FPGPARLRLSSGGVASVDFFLAIEQRDGVSFRHILEERVEEVSKHKQANNEALEALCVYDGNTHHEPLTLSQEIDYRRHGHGLFLTDNLEHLFRMLCERRLQVLPRMGGVPRDEPTRFP